MARSESVPGAHSRPARLFWSRLLCFVCISLISSWSAGQARILLFVSVCTSASEMMPILLPFLLTWFLVSASAQLAIQPIFVNETTRSTLLCLFTFPITPTFRSPDVASLVDPPSSLPRPTSPSDAASTTSELTHAHACRPPDALTPFAAPHNLGVLLSAAGSAGGRLMSPSGSHVALTPADGAVDAGDGSSSAPRCESDGGRLRGPGTPRLPPRWGG